MRPFEILIFVLITLSLLTHFFNTTTRSYLFRFLPGLGILIIIAHISFEGARWQMIPSYVIAGTIFIVSLKSLFYSKQKHSIQKTLRRRIMKVSLLIFALLITVLAILPPVVLPVFRMPEPKGQF